MPQFSPMKWMIISMMPFIMITFMMNSFSDTKMTNKSTMWMNKKMNWKW